MPLSTGSVGVILSPQVESVSDLLQSQISSELLVVGILACVHGIFQCRPFDPLSIPLSLPSFLSSLSRLELLSTITEIRGYLRIDGWRQQTFPYLRNLRRVGSPNGTAVNTFCNDGQRCEFSFFHLSSTAKLIIAYCPCR